MTNDSRLLVQQTPNRAVHIMANDMLHITWKHATIRLNVTGMIYLLRFLDGIGHQTSSVTHFQISGTPDDGYQLWIQDVGLRLSAADYRSFRQLLVHALGALRRNDRMPLHFSDPALLFTVEQHRPDQGASHQN